MALQAIPWLELPRLGSGRHAYASTGKPPNLMASKGLHLTGDFSVIRPRTWYSRFRSRAPLFFSLEKLLYCPYFQFVGGMHVAVCRYDGGAACRFLDDRQRYAGIRQSALEHVTELTEGDVLDARDLHCPPE
jgi:hypothetical protein